MFYENVFDNSFLVNEDQTMKVKEERPFIFFFIYLSLLHPLSLVLRSLMLKKL